MKYTSSTERDADRLFVSLTVAGILAAAMSTLMIVLI